MRDLVQKRIAKKEVFEQVKKNVIEDFLEYLTEEQRRDIFAEILKHYDMVTGRKANACL